MMLKVVLDMLMLDFNLWISSVDMLMILKCLTWVRNSKIFDVKESETTYVDWMFGNSHWSLKLLHFSKSR